MVRVTYLFVAEAPPRHNSGFTNWCSTENPRCSRARRAHSRNWDLLSDMIFPPSGSDRPLPEKNRGIFYIYVNILDTLGHTYADIYPLDSLLA